MQIYNLSEYSRNHIKAKDQAVIVKAGYVDLIEQVCSGVIKRVEHRREGVDVVTELELKDGGRDLLEPEFKRSYAKATSRAKIVEDILAAMPHTSRGRLSAAGLSGVTSGKLSFSTTCKLALDRLARAWGFEWSVQDGALQVLEPDGTVEPAELALSLSPDTGLIGSPARTGQEGRRGAGTRARAKRTGARFQALLMPSIRPGRYVLLESEFLSGALKVQSCTHAGDTHGQDWTTDVEAVQL